MWCVVLLIWSSMVCRVSLLSRGVCLGYRIRCSLMESRISDDDGVWSCSCLEQSYSTDNQLKLIDIQYKRSTLSQHTVLAETVCLCVCVCACA